ncbi:phosphatidate cytidylyltransferase [Arthrobacter alpinus]|uniref:Phosphatidate cytidylyltransferase n=1 Tax=Arthrobacter alpinus TaxID=656366 RepID=A0A1H5K2B1_9MICC|nr:phosphatidate cytidylyltransferase [Arthrobacter alpinus]
MTDPKSTLAGSQGEPAASNPTPELIPAPAEYQFPTRKARRHAELTGMIPIIVPKNAAAEPAAGQQETGKNDAETTPGTSQADAPVEQVEAAEQVDTEQDKPDSPAAPLGEASGVGHSMDTELPMDAETDSENAPRPVSAMQVTGLPVIPVPQGPVGAMPEAATTLKAARTPKAGRDLPAAISVGVGLLVLVVVSLLFFPVAFVFVATVFACVGVWEVNRAIGTRGIKAPTTPIMVGALAMPISAYFAGAEGLLFALVASAAATVLWRSLDSEPGAVKSILAGVFSLMWIPFLLSFVFLMLRGDQQPILGLTLDLGNISPGVIEVLIMLMLVVANDTFGYLVGVIFGKHPMAPKISPKKSWEGFAGSLAGATLVAIPATMFLLDQQWWVGLVLAVGLVFAGTGGDFAESMVKRELGVKDMSNLLPGHGGVMDRLDSILFAAPVAYAIFTVVGQF